MDDSTANPLTIRTHISFRKDYECNKFEIIWSTAAILLQA